MAATLDFSIGNIKLDRFEVPGEFDFGHELKFAHHQAISETGEPVIKVHPQGAFPLPTKWKAVLFNDGALSRAAQLDRLMTAQQTVLFVYGPLTFNCIIKMFKAIVHHQYEIEYEIELIVLQNLNGANPVVPSGVPFDLGIQQYYNNGKAAVSAMVLADVKLPASLTATTSAIDAALVVAFPLNTQPPATIRTLLTLLDAANTAINLYAGPLMASAVIEADLAKLNASLAALGNYGLMRTNLAQLVGSGPFTQTVTSFVGDLFTLASQMYPNADPALVAPAIAAANNLFDMFVTVPSTLQLPPVFS